MTGVAPGVRPVERMNEMPLTSRPLPDRLPIAVRDLEMVIARDKTDQWTTERLQLVLDGLRDTQRDLRQYAEVICEQSRDLDRCTCGTRAPDPGAAP